MAYLTGTIAGVFLCLGLGWYSLAVALAGLLALAGYFRRDKVLSALSLSLAVSSFFSTSSVAFDATSVVEWLVCLYLGSMLFPNPSRAGIPMFSIPLVLWVLVSQFTGRTFQVQFLLPPLVACLPTPQMPLVIGRLRKSAPAILWLIPILLVAFSVMPSRPKDNGVAYIQNGKWALTDQPFRLKGLDIASSYSYSEFLRLIGGHLCEPSALSNKEQIAWIITPTKPFTEQDLAMLDRWVRQGGHLIAVSDHTDLFGHGRTLNALLSRFGVSCTYSATITDKARDPITYGNGATFSILTGNTISGSSIWPLATTLEYMEGAYYGRPNFFGPLSPESSTPFSRWIIMGCKSFGKGYVTLVTDSTVLSNFAVFQPETAGFIEMAQSRPLMAALMNWLPLGVLISLLLALLARWTRPLPVCLLGFISMISLPGPGLHWTEHYLIWSGDKSLVLDNSNPEESFTTAFSISPLSGSRPRWTDSPSINDRGIWVAKTPPPNQNWKWLTPKRNKNAEVIPHDPRFNSLLGALGAEPLLGWQSIQDAQIAQAGSIWTDDHMGTWWFDRGLSPAREARFQAFLDWISSKTLPPNPEAFVPENSEDTEFVFRMEGSDREITLKCPKLPNVSAPILIGNGISAQMVKIGGLDTLISVSPWMEYWQSPKIWTAAEKKGEKGK